ncbi:MAG: OmpH family outer membrane protein [Kiritimatiellae bacterium]|nr:OmpH family outer membrane protein [Kiritimatiellia bacterium]
MPTGKSPRIKASVLLVLCATATAFCALAFANNVVAIAQWWSAFLAAGGDSSSVAAKMPGFIPWLTWSAVDYSAVTTFIPLLGFLCMTFALGRIVAGRRIRAEDFPFFRGSDQLNVALGLFGTLWGIIVIGYFRLDTVTMADLMQCLHTALFSTLTAVVWVFLIDRPLVRPYFARLLERSGLAETDEGDLAAAVERLVERLGAASDAFDRRQSEFEAAFERRQAAYEQKFEQRQAAYERDFDARQKEYVEFFRRRIDELERRAEGAEKKLKKVAEAVLG